MIILEIPLASLEAGEDDPPNGTDADRRTVAITGDNWHNRIFDKLRTYHRPPYIFSLNCLSYTGNLPARRCTHGGIARSSSP